ncbi:MAG: cytochrome C biogenesis protein [Methanomicrobiales archaeon]|nr:cytochrome C biogenesis protein [Methanomicrobiales archaeon]
MAALPASLALSFVAGLAAPLGAVCVLPLYPAFLAFLAGQAGGKGPAQSPLALGLAVAAGVLGGMFIFGLVVAGVLQASLSSAIGHLAPFLYAAMGLAGAVLAAGIDPGRYLPPIRAPAGKTPVAQALLFGMFFGLISLPCNPGPILLVFVISSTAGEYAIHLLHFLLFGAGMASPLLVMAGISTARNRMIVGFLERHHAAVTRATGCVLVAVALFSLFAFAGW